MNYVIWGAGETGQRALHFLGYLRVRCFVDNNIEGEIYDRVVYRFDEYISGHSLPDDIIVIASKNHSEEMEKILKSNNIKTYFLYDWNDDYEIKKTLPFTIVFRKRIDYEYSTILEHYDLSKAKRISIIGVNKFIHYLICELKFQTNDAEISIVDDEALLDYYTLGSKNISFDNAYEQSDYIIINSPIKKTDIRYEVLLRNLDRSKFIDIYDVDRFEGAFKYPKLKKLYKKCDGKRIFLIGNGPSLNVRDLDVLAQHNEICIGCNKIYKIFDKTKWRPNIITVSDADYIERFQNEMNEVDSIKIVADHFHRNYKCDREMKVYSFIHLIEEQYDDNHPRLSSDIYEGVYLGYTVIYEIALQLAIYMGATDIILLGVDMNNFGQHFCEDYHIGEEAVVLNKAVEKEKYFKPFEVVKSYAEKSGILIRNATRGGALEVFNRVDFDSLFQ